MDGGGDGPPTLRGPGGKPPFMFPTDPPESGGDMSWPRLLGYGPSLSMGGGYDHSLPPRDTGDNGAFRAFMVVEGIRGRGLDVSVKTKGREIGWCGLDSPRNNTTHSTRRAANELLVMPQGSNAMMDSTFFRRDLLICLVLRWCSVLAKR